MIGTARAADRVAIGPIAANPLPGLFMKKRGTQSSPLVFLPGVGGTTRYFETRVAPLAREHQIVLVDLLGFGQSPKPWVRYTVNRHVAALHRALANCEAFTLVGHSFGAVVAVAYAACYPAQLKGLVLLSLPCFGGVKQALQYYRGQGGPDRWIMTSVALAIVTCIVTRRLLGHFLPRLLSDLPREVAEDLVQHTWLSSASTIWDGLYHSNVAKDADRLPPELPVLCLHGDRDVTAPLEFVRRLREGRAGWALQVLPGVDHHPLLRDPVDCLAAIREFATCQSGKCQSSL